MGISGLAVFLFFSSTMSNGQFKLLGLNFKLRSHWHDQPHDGIPDRLPSPRGLTVISPSRLVPIIATSPEPMATARLGQMVTLSPRRLAEQPLRRACRRAAALAAALQSRRHRNRDRPPPVMPVRSPPSRSLPRQPRRSGFRGPGKSARPRAAGTGRTGALTGTCSHFSICITPCTHCLRHSLV
jgi:hypothetical protein